MYYDLKQAMQECKATRGEIIAAAGVSRMTYSKYEKAKQIPSRILYRIWKSVPGYPIPDDFFDYTSYNLGLNMRCHHLRQVDIANMFGLSKQSIVSNLLKENVPMYELKDKFQQFDPFYISTSIDTDSDETKQITDLATTTNFGFMWLSKGE